MKQETIDKVLLFRDERNWSQFHNPKDLALSLTLEAAELLELFQWKSSEEASEVNREKMKEELADVLMYSILFADRMGFDLEEIVLSKLEKNGKKYPVELARDSKEKYDALKRAHREDK